MQSHFELLAQVADLTPILAIASLAPWEHGFESTDTEPPLRVQEGESPRERVLYVGEPPQPCLRCIEVKDDLELRFDTAPVQKPVATVLVAMGFSVSTSPVAGAMLGRLDKDLFHERIHTLDAAWILLRRLNATQPDAASAIEAAEVLVDFSRRWHQSRVDDLNGDTSHKGLDRHEGIAGQASALQQRLHGCKRIELLFDPRGGACEITFADTPHPYALAALALTWLPGKLYAPAVCGQKPASSGPVSTTARYKPRPTPLKADVQQVLLSAQVDGLALRIHQQLNRRLYELVNDVLVSMGGRWHVGQKAHVFDTDPKPLLAAALASGGILTDRDYEYFRTPDSLADEVIVEACLAPGMQVLEPHAGDGQFAARAVAIVGVANVTCYELMPANIARLRARGLTIDAPTDFLEVPPEPRFDVVLANPPFSGGRDVVHLTHAMQFLRPGGRMVAVTSTQWRERDTKPLRAFRERLEAMSAHVRELPRGTFHESGTDVPTLLVSLTMPTAASAAQQQPSALRRLGRFAIPQGQPALF